MPWTISEISNFGNYVQCREQEKQQKYILALLRILIKGSTSSKELEKIVGYLVTQVMSNHFVVHLSLPFRAESIAKIPQK